MTSLEDKVVLITGGTSGIGRAAAEAFARAGARIVLAGTRTARALHR
jgi:NAD(P)-dependent dehydrogenase (short-subunit alcohol dehydrogenase family)